MLTVNQDKGKDEAYDETRASGRRLAGKRGLSRPTRFDDVSHAHLVSIGICKIQFYYLMFLPSISWCILSDTKIIVFRFPRMRLMK